METAPAAKVSFLESLAPDSRERARPSLRAAVAGLGGFVLAGGQFAVIAGTDPTRAKLIIASAVALACAYALRLGVKVVEVAAAAVGMAAIAIPVLGSALTVSSGRGQAVTGLVIGSLYVAAWAAPGFRGRNLFLALGLLALLQALGSLSSSNPSTDLLSSSALTRVTDTVGTQGVVYLIGAAALLAGAWALDRRGFRGTATKLNSDTGPALVSLVGAVVCLVGAHGERRATTWWGAGMLTGGVTAFVLIQWKPTSAVQTGLALLVSGVVLVLAPLVGSRFRN
jgi:hypothetical protein